MGCITHQALFNKMRDDRVIQKAVKHAHWTLPYVMADYSEMQSKSLVLERDYQSVGGLLVNNLASKLGRLLFPAQYPFFKIAASAKLRKLASSKGVSEEDFNQSVARQEMQASQLLFRNASYNQLVLMLKHLIITGNALLYRDVKNHRTVCYGLQSYALKRDGQGNMVDCVLRESTYVEALPKNIQDYLIAADKARYSRPECEVEVFTRINRCMDAKGDFIYEVSQQVGTVPVGEPIRYREHLCPWRAVSWNLISGENYARGMVEDYAGDFAKLSNLSEASTLYMVEMMRVVHLVRSGSGADVDDLNKAECGEYIAGDAEGVSAHESGDSAKAQAAEAAIDKLVARLSKAFMYNVNTRDAERVTMYELKQDAEEAENALGGHYSVLAESVQVPLAHILLAENEPDMVFGFITEDVKVDVEAGIPALGRAADVQNLLMAVQEITAVAAVPQIDKRVDPQKMIDLILAGRSVDSSTIFKSDEQMRRDAQNEQQVQQGVAQMQQAAAGAAALQGSNQLNQLLQG